MNSFKTFINKVGDRVREATPQGTSVVEGSLVQGNLMEGFVCPTCFKKFDCPELLQKHYEDDHITPSANYLCPVCQARLSSQEDLELHYTSNHNEKDFSNHSLELLKEELKEVTSNLREERWHSEELKKDVDRLHEAFLKKDTEESDVYIHKFQLDAAEEAKLNLSSEVIHLRKQLAETLQHTGMIISENQTLGVKLSTSSSEKDNYIYKIEDLQTEIDTYKQFKEDAQKVVKNMKADKTIKEELEEELKTCLIELEEKNRMIKLSTEENEHMKKKLYEKEEEINISVQNVENFKNECHLVKDNLNAKHEEVNGLIAKLNAQEKILEEFQTSIEPTSDDALKPENAQLLQEYTDKIANLDKRNRAIMSDFEDAIKKKLDAESMAKVKEEKFTSILSSHQTSLGKTKNQLQISEEEVLKGKSTIESLNIEINLLKDKAELLKDECRQLKGCLAEARELEKKNKQELEEIRQQVDNISQSHDKKCSVLEDKDAELEKLKEAQESLLSQFDEIVGKLTSKDSQIVALLNEKENFRNDSNLLMKQIESHKSNITNFEISENEMKKQLITNKDMIDALKCDLTVCQGEKHREQEEFKSLIKTFEAKEQTTIKQVEKLEQQAKSVAVWKKEYAETNEKLQICLRAAVSETKSVKDSHDLVIETNTAYHEQIKKSEIELTHLKMLKTKLENELETFATKLADAESEIKSGNVRVTDLDEKIGALEAEMAGLAGDKLELEVRLEAASEERQSLLNRCISSEKEVERLQVEINNLRRRLEDSTAALHDLGRANQSLQIETNKLASRKWMEDSEITNCTECAKNFTVTNRRHHCRNCGQIFCNDCSSKLAPLDSNKKPVRVCDNCHVELSSKT